MRAVTVGFTICALAFMAGMYRADSTTSTRLQDFVILRKVEWRCTDFTTDNSSGLPETTCIQFSRR